MKTNKKPFARHNLTITIIGDQDAAVLLMQILEAHRHDNTIDVRTIARATKYLADNPDTPVDRLDRPHLILSGPALPLFDLSLPATFDTPEAFVVHYKANSAELPTVALQMILSAHPGLVIELGHSKRLAACGYSAPESIRIFPDLL